MRVSLYRQAITFYRHVIARSECDVAIQGIKLDCHENASWIMRGSEKRGFPHLDVLGSLSLTRRTCANPPHNYATVTLSLMTGEGVRRTGEGEKQESNEILRSAQNDVTVTKEATRVQLTDNSLPSYPPIFLPSKKDPSPKSKISTLPQGEGKRVAFTLAEVLITLGIIGIVAAMTMPTLIAKHKEKQTIVHLKKVDSLLSQAFSRIREEEGGVELDRNTFQNSEVVMMERFGKYLQYQKTCPLNVGGCFKSQMYKSSTGVDYSNFNNAASRSSAILSDGTMMMFNIRSADDSNPQMIAQVYVDLNGSKQPNRLGEDFFYFFLLGDRIFPGGAPECGDVVCSPASFINGCIKRAGHNCTAWAIYNENLDYLRCPDKLGWNSAHSCKD